VFALVYQLFKDWDYKRRAKRAGCGTTKTRLDFPFLGFRAAYYLFKNLTEHTLLDFSREQIKETGGMTGRMAIAGEYRIMTVDPENVKSVLATNFKDYSLGMRYEAFKPLLGDGIFTLSGEGWKHSRAMLRPQFSRDQVSQLESLRDHVGVLVNKFKTLSEENPTGFFDSQLLFHNLTLDTATEFLFGESVDSLRAESKKLDGREGTASAGDFARAFNYCLGILARRVLAGPLYFVIDSPHFRSEVRVCKNFVDYFVRQVLENPKELADESRYVFIRELAKETRDPVLIRDQSFNILLAGRDTTASLLSYCTFYLARDKRVWNKLRDAVLNDFGTSDDGLTFEALKRCQYLNHVINEVLRLNPIVPVNFRTAIRDTKLPRGGGPDESEPVFVPKGTQVFYTMYTTHRETAFWGDDALEFRPERWEEAGVHSWDYLPFNGGPRICLGQQFALTETAFTLVRICQTFSDIIPDPKHTKLKHFAQLTTSVSQGVPVRFVV
jgi:cytochrome P450